MLKIFSGNANPKFGEDIALSVGKKPGRAIVDRFSDNEIYVKYEENVRGADVFIVQPTVPPAENILELLFMIDAARRASASRITAVIPYFGYARQERKDQPRVSISAKLVSNMIQTAGADRVLTMDLHAAAIQGFFDIPVDHLYSSAIFINKLKHISLTNPVIVSPDIGSTTRSSAFASRIPGDLAIVYKKRSAPGKIDQMDLMGNVENRDAILVDDMIDSAGTLCKAADLISEAGANKIYAACTQPLLSGEAVTRIKNSKINKVLISDTIPLANNKRHKKIEVLSAAGLFGEAIRRIHNSESISSLFD